MSTKLLTLLALTGLSSPAFAAHYTAPTQSAKAGLTILAKSAADKESSAEGKAPVCRQAVKPMTEGRVSRSTNCPKQRPILM